MRLNKQNMSGDQKVELQIAPLIDVVFLLLIYFMVTASLIKKEGDISFLLPADIPAEQIVDLPIEVLIEIMADGVVEVEGRRFANQNRLLDELVMQLAQLKAIAEAQSAPFSVNLLPDSKTLHDRVIDVMDACAAAGVKNLSFSKSI